jgi:hypothetical protein
MTTHPAVLDNGIHVATQLLDYRQSDPTYVPVGIGLCKIWMAEGQQGIHQQYRVTSVLTDCLSDRHRHDHSLLPSHDYQQLVFISELISKPMVLPSKQQGSASMASRKKFSHDILDVLWSASDTIENLEQWLSIVPGAASSFLQLQRQEPAAICGGVVSAIQVGAYFNLSIDLFFFKVSKMIKRSLTYTVRVWFGHVENQGALLQSGDVNMRWLLPDSICEGASMPGLASGTPQVMNSFLLGLIRTVAMESKTSQFEGVRFSTLQSCKSTVGQISGTADKSEDVEVDDGVIIRGRSKLVPILRATPACTITYPFRLMPNPRGAFSNLQTERLSGIDNPPPGMFTMKGELGAGALVVD